MLGARCRAPPRWSRLGLGRGSPLPARDAPARPTSAPAACRRTSSVGYARARSALLGAGPQPRRDHRRRTCEGRGRAERTEGAPSSAPTGASSDDAAAPRRRIGLSLKGPAGPAERAHRQTAKVRPRARDLGRRARTRGRRARLSALVDSNRASQTRGRCSPCGSGSAASDEAQADRWRVRLRCSASAPDASSRPAAIRRGSFAASSSARSEWRTRLFSISDCSVSGSAPANSLGGGVRAAAGEHGQPLEELLLHLLEEAGGSDHPIVARNVCWRGSAPRAPLEQVEPLRQDARRAVPGRRQSCGRRRARGRAGDCRASQQSSGTAPFDSKRGSSARARVRKSSTASSESSGGTGYSHSPEAEELAARHQHPSLGQA